MATGGSAQGQQAYIVGEKGPEVFVPNQNGQIIPNHRAAAWVRPATGKDKKELPGMADGGAVTAGIAGAWHYNTELMRNQAAADRQAQTLAAQKAIEQEKESGLTKRQKKELRDREDARHDVWAHNLGISQAKEAEDNWHFFANAVATMYGQPDPTGKNLIIPENVKQAMFKMHGDALRNPDLALKNLTGHIQELQETAKQWEAHKAYYIRDREQATGKKLTPGEVQEIDKWGTSDPERAAKIIGALQSRGAKPWQPEPQKETTGLGLWTPWDKKAPAQQQPPAIGQEPQPGQAPASTTQPPLVPPVAGESSADYLGRANPRNDQLSAVDAGKRYYQAVDEATQGTGAVGAVAGWMAKHNPVVRTLEDPNYIVNRGARWVGNKVAEAYSPALAGPQQVESPQVSPWLAGVTPELAKQSAQTMGVTDETGNVLHGPGGRPVQVGQPAGVNQDTPTWLQPQNVAGAAPEDVNNLRGAGGRPLTPAPQQPWYSGGQ